MSDIDKLQQAYTDIWKAVYDWRDDCLTTVELEKSLLRFARQQQAVAWREAAKVSLDAQLDEPEKTDVVFNDACREIAEHCEAKAKELEA